MNEPIEEISTIDPRPYYDTALKSGIGDPVILGHQLESGAFACTGLSRDFVAAKLKEAGLVKEAEYLMSQRDKAGIDIVTCHLDDLVAITHFTPTPENPSLN